MVGVNHILYVHSSVASPFGYCDGCCYDYGVLPLGFCSDGHGEPGSSFCSDCVKEPLFVQFGILSEIQKEQPPESPRVIQLRVCLHVPGFLSGWSDQAEITVDEIRSEESERCSERVSLVHNSEAFVERKGIELLSPHRVESP